MRETPLGPVLFSAVLLSATFACGVARSDRAGKVEPQVAVGPVADASKPPVGKSIDWFDGSLDEAFAEAKSSGKPIFVDVGAYWCSPCHKLEETTFRDPKVIAHFEAKYINLHIDAEKVDGPYLVERYAVSSYPTLLFIDPNGLERARLEDYQSAEELLKKASGIEAGPTAVQSAITKGGDHAKFAAAIDVLDAKVGSSSTDTLRDFGMELQAKNENGRLFNMGAFLLGKFEASVGDDDEALVVLRSLQLISPKSAWSKFAVWEIATIRNQLGDTKAAEGTLTSFISETKSNESRVERLGWMAVRGKIDVAFALGMVEQELKENDELPALHHVAAELKLRQGEKAAATKLLERAIELEKKTTLYRERLKAVEAVGSGK